LKGSGKPRALAARLLNEANKGGWVSHRPREDTCVLLEEYLERVAWLDET
jgi:hypothetical protein